MARSRPAVALVSLALLLDFLTPNPVSTHKPCRYRLAALLLCDVSHGGATKRKPAGHIRRIAPPDPPETVAAPIELQILRDRTQEHLQHHWKILAWRRGTMQLVAELPIPLVEQIIGQFLAASGLTASYIRLQEGMAHPEQRPLLSAPARGPLRALGVPLRPVQEARQRARYARKGRVRRPPSRGTGPAA